MKRRLSSLLFALVLPTGSLACGGADSLDPAEQTEDSTASPTPVYATPTDDDATLVAVRNGMTLTLHAELTWHAGPELVLLGETSQNITEVYGFIPDDGFGTSTQLGPRSFQLVFDNASDINTVISGNPFYLKITTHTVSGDHTSSAQLYASPRLVQAAAMATTTRLALGAAVTPTSVSSNPEGVVFRGTATTTLHPQSLTVTADSPPTLVADSTHAWHFDWDFSHFESAATGKNVEATAKFGASTSTRAGAIAIRLSKIGLAAGDSPDDIYGFPVCDPEVLACLRTLPPDTGDFGVCGAFFPVSVCVDTVGFPVP